MNPGAAIPPPSASTDIARDARLLQALLEGVPEYVYFKDRDSRFIAVSASLVRVLGKTRADEIVGRTSFDLLPASRARSSFTEEQEIIRTGRPMIDRLVQELWPTGKTAWVISAKFPLRNRAGAIIGIFGLSKDVTQKWEMEQELEKAHRDLVDASRVAGMAEVATGVLHNVGNVLNSLNVSASLIGTGLRQFKAESLGRIADLLRAHEHDLGVYLSTDSKGKRVPEFLASVAEHSREERDRLQQEIAALQKNIDHIKEIVAMQQAYATMIGVVESLDPAVLVEDAMRMNAGSLQRRDFIVERDFTPVPRVLGEQSKILQILVNLIRNAKVACDDSGAATKRITLRIQLSGDNRVQISIRDNGVGIPPANLTRIFQHGFTTRAQGHGFGLHSAANAAREMKGSLTVHSDGPGTGATFTLELPIAPTLPTR